MQTLNNAELAFLSILSYPELTAKTLRLCADNTMLFTPTFCPHLYRMWSGYLATLAKHKQQYGLKISKDLMAAGISEHILSDKHMPEELLKKCDYILQRLIVGDVPSKEEGTELIQTMVKLDANRKIGMKVTMNADILELQHALDASKKALSSFDEEDKEDLSCRVVYNPFREMDKIATHAERIPTGINWLDEVTSGGGRAGELWLILGSSGGGKCLGRDTEILMYDGSIKKVQDIIIGDILMGPDSTPRSVLALGRGRSKMYKIIPAKGTPYVVNDQHILTLVNCSSDVLNINGKQVGAGALLDISVQEYLALPEYKKELLKGVRCSAVDFHKEYPTCVDPYFAGVYLGGGSRNKAQLTLSDEALIRYCKQYAEVKDWAVNVKRCADEACWSVHLRYTHTKKGKAVAKELTALLQNDAGDRIIPQAIKTGPVTARLQVLAGLLDTEGYLHNGHYEITTEFDTLAKDILFVARSLGYAAYDNYCQKKCCSTGAVGMYHRITISGDFGELPMLVASKICEPSRQLQNVLHTGINIEGLPEDDYYGFVIDGDHRFVLGDFTITHNTAISVQYACAQALMGNNVLWATYEQALEGDIAERIISCVTNESLDNIRDIGFNNLKPEIQQKFWAAVAGADERLIVMDMTKAQLDTSQDVADNGGMYSVWKQYRALKEQGTVVKTIIIDWVGAMMSLVGSVTHKDLSNGYRFMLQAEIDIARRMVKEEGIQIIFFHQTDSKSQHARPIYVPDKTCSKDAKDLCNYMDIVLTLGIRDVNNVCWFSAAKSRKGAAITKTIQLIGDKSRFVTADGWLPNHDGNFYKPGEDYIVDSSPGPADDGALAYTREIE